MTTSPDLAELIADVRERARYLLEIGVESMAVDLAALEGPALSAAAVKPAAVKPSALAGAPPPAEPKTVIEPKPVEPRKPGSRLGSLPSLSARTTSVRPGKSAASGVPDDQGGAQTQKPEIAPVESQGRPDIPAEVRLEETATALPAPVLAAPPLPVPTETIDHIRAEIGPDCTRCPLHALGRSRVVNSVGNFDAELMFVGEAPGADEDQQGEPFVGRAGQLLTKIIESIGVRREDVFIGNINRCRPPGNRAPEPVETAACKPFLKREIAVVRPRVIVVLGATAAQNLLETKVPIGKLRGHFHDYLGVKVMPTFHPAYLLRDPHKKREVWEDMKIVRDYLARTPAEM